MKTFKVYRDYYDVGCDIILKDEITLTPGLTVLVGCNGAGKTTLIQQLQGVLRSQDVEFIEHSNLHAGQKAEVERLAFYNEFEKLATVVQSSEGENIVFILGNVAKKIGELVRKTEQKEIFVFLDATDSGLSIDNVIEIKDFFRFAQENDPHKEFYFIVSANEYEMANGEQCFDVRTGEYTTFEDYEDFRRFVLDSRAFKDSRKYKRRSGR